MSKGFSKGYGKAGEAQQSSWDGWTDFTKGKGKGKGAKGGYDASYAPGAAAYGGGYEKAAYKGGYDSYPSAYSAGGYDSSSYGKGGYGYDSASYAKSAGKGKGKDSLPPPPVFEEKGKGKGKGDSKGDGKGDSKGGSKGKGKGKGGKPAVFGGAQARCGRNSQAGTRYAAASSSEEEAEYDCTKVASAALDRLAQNKSSVKGDLASVEPSAEDKNFEWDVSTPPFKPAPKQVSPKDTSKGKSKSSDKESSKKGKGNGKGGNKKAATPASPEDWDVSA